MLMMRRLIGVLTLAGLGALGCSDGGAVNDGGIFAEQGSPDATQPDASPDGATEAGASCPRYRDPEIMGEVSASAINEASGLAASRQEELLWVHNDSGDKARIYAVDRKTAELLATYRLEGVSARDFEDIALGPGPTPGQDYLYIGDIGDNSKKRKGIVVYRVAEPRVGEGASGEQVLAGVEALQLRYPDGAQNAETLLVEPTSSDLYVLTKDIKHTVTTIYVAEAPLSTTATTTLKTLGELRFREGVLSGVKSGLLTAGDIAVDGSGVLLRTYRDVLYWPWPAGMALSQALVDIEPCVLPEVFEGQGEAIAFAADGSYYTLSEGQNQPLYRYSPER